MLFSFWLCRCGVCVCVCVCVCVVCGVCGVWCVWCVWCVLFVACHLLAAVSVHAQYCIHGNVTRYPAPTLPVPKGWTLVYSKLEMDLKESPKGQNDLEALRPMEGGERGRGREGGRGLEGEEGGKEGEGGGGGEGEGEEGGR